MSMKTIRIPLATKPDIPNGNGLIYSKQTLEKALIPLREKISTRTAFTLNGFPRWRNISEAMHIDMTKVNGMIIDKTEEDIEVEPISPFGCEQIERMIKMDETVAVMNAIGTVDIIDGISTIREGTLHIISYSIVPKSLSAYSKI